MLKMLTRLLPHQWAQTNQVVPAGYRIEFDAAIGGRGDLPATFEGYQWSGLYLDATTNDEWIIQFCKGKNFKMRRCWLYDTVFTAPDHTPEDRLDLLELADAAEQRAAWLVAAARQPENSDRVAELFIEAAMRLLDAQGYYARLYFPD